MKNFLIMLILLYTSGLHAEDKNLGFMVNQKYVCIGTEAIVGDKIITIQSKEDAMKYPTRFYIDDNNILHTDGRVDNILQYTKPSIYESDDSVILLEIQDNQRMMFRAIKKGKAKGLVLIHSCLETDNWTLVR